MDGTFKIWTFNQSISVTLSEKHFYCPKVEILRFILFISLDVSDYLQVSTTVIKCRFGPAGKLYSSSLPKQTCFILALGIWTHIYTANFYPTKTTGQGITGCLQVFPTLSIEKGCKNHSETLCMLWVNPAMPCKHLQCNCVV